MHDERAPSAAAFAPATVANVTVGFDVLGFALDGVGDRVTVDRIASEHVEVGTIAGLVPDLPRDPALNTAAVALTSLLGDVAPGHGFRVSLDKGIPLGSGMGGSAASAVGAVVAANALLARPLGLEELLPHALAGEAVAGGAAHADNVAPCLHGGMTAVVSSDPLRVAVVPVPTGLVVALVHPHLTIETREARRVLREQLTLAEHVSQSMRLTGFLLGCFRNDVDLIASSMRDEIVEPQRSSLIPGFDAARAAALERGGLGFGIAGSGPSVFVWARSRREARDAGAAVVEAFERHAIDADLHVSPLGVAGARLVPPAPREPA